jgi:hypothetical protein
MNYQNTLTTNYSDKPYKSSGFLVTEVQRTRFTAALNIARQMNVPGDDAVDEAVRAIVLLRGGAYFDDKWHEMAAADEADYDRQATAYYDGVGQLIRLLDEDQDMTDRRATSVKS